MKNSFIILTHWSRLTCVNDSFVANVSEHGTGYKGAEAARRRDYPALFLPRVYAGMGDYVKEHGLGKHRFACKLDLNRSPLYFTGTGQQGSYWPSAMEMMDSGYAPFDHAAAACVWEGYLKAAGFAGYADAERGIVALFYNVKLYRVPDSDFCLRPSDPEADTLPISPCGREA